MTESNSPLPLVSIICTVYNQASYIIETLDSVKQQTYSAIELIIIDNASSDHSLSLLQQYCQRYLPKATIIANTHNCGLCSAFNQGLAMSKGKYVIDLSGDDVLLPSRIAQQVSFFEKCSGNTAAIFSNAIVVNEVGQQISLVHSHQHIVPSGDVFEDILKRYFICTPTLMFKSEHVKAIGGYDTTLSYEDFDITLRLARSYRIEYQPEVLVQKRLHTKALSLQVIQPNNQLLPSTYRICQKALQWCRSDHERLLLYRRIETFVRKSFYSEQFLLANSFLQLLPPTCDLLFSTRLITILIRYEVKLNRLYKCYILTKLHLRLLFRLA